MASMTLLGRPLADRYRLPRPVGEDQIALTYLAHDLSSDRVVSVSVLRPEIRDVVDTDRFVSVMQRVNALQHPHLVPQYDADQVGRTLFTEFGENQRQSLENAHC